MPLHRGIVVDNVDPAGRGRCRIRTKQPTETPVEAIPWIEMCSPMGGGDNISGAGMMFVPDIGVQVFLLEEGNDASQLVYIGSSFFREGAHQNAPIENRITTVEPLNRIIKTRGGHKLELDDRVKNGINEITYGVRLTSGNGDELNITKGKGIRLGFGASGGELKMNEKGLKLTSNKGAGLFLNDSTGVVRLKTSTDNAFLQMADGKAILYGEKGVFLETDSTYTMNAKKGLDISAVNGLVSLRGSTGKFISTGDLSFQAGGSLNINSPQMNITGTVGSNFLLDYVVPGDGTTSGNIVLNTAAGNVMLRSGLFLIPGVPKVNSGTTLINDEGFGLTTTGRIGIGPGATVMENKVGGIWISGVPLPIIGGALGLGGRAVVPLSPILPTGAGASGTVQPMVLGGNMFQFLTGFLNALNVLCTGLLSSTPVFSVGPVGPNILGPGPVAAITAFLGTLTSLQLLHVNPIPGSPLNINSSIVFLDG